MAISYTFMLAFRARLQSEAAVEYGRLGGQFIPRESTFIQSLLVYWNKADDCTGLPGTMVE